MKRKRLVAISLLLALACAETALALTGEITHLSGAVVARRADGAARILSVKSEVREGDLLLTADNAYARVRWADGAETVLRPNTQVRIDAYAYDERRPQSDNVVLSLIKGGMRTVTGLLARRNPANFRLATPTATVGIRGTHFGALFCRSDCAGIPTPGGAAPADGLYVDVADGAIVVFNPAGSLEIRIGEFGFAATLADAPVRVPPERGIRVPLPSAALNLGIRGGSVGKASEQECTIQ
jgi:hypothetical protein